MVIMLKLNQDKIISLVSCVFLYRTRYNSLVYYLTLLILVNLPQEAIIILQHSINDTIMRQFIIVLIRVVEGLIICRIVRYSNKEENLINSLSV